MNRLYDAVIFDLFGTLVDNVTDAVYHYLPAGDSRTTRYSLRGVHRLLGRRVVPPSASRRDTAKHGRTNRLYQSSVRHYTDGGDARWTPCDCSASVLASAA